MSLNHNPLPGVPDVESPLFEKVFQSKGVSVETINVARKLRTDGFAVIDLPEPDFDRLASGIIQTLDKQFDWAGWRNGTNRNLRVQDAWQEVAEVKQLACNPHLLKLLSELYGRRPFPFQTLNFPVGTQQHFHTDSMHFSSCPERFMCGVWVALEEIDSDNGPLVYYPGSHALPIYSNEHLGVIPNTQGNVKTYYFDFEKAWETLVEALELKPLYFHAKKGQALIWSANLLHGGAKQNDLNRTRHSQVTHYFFDDCCYYTPWQSMPFLGPIFFRDVVDISTGQHVPNRLNGTEVSKDQIEQTVPGKYLFKPTRTPQGFDPEAYLKANPDVASAQVDPTIHWLEFGYREGRPIR